MTGSGPTAHFAQYGPVLVVARWDVRNSWEDVGNSREGIGNSQEEQQQKTALDKVA